MFRTEQFCDFCNKNIDISLQTVLTPFLKFFIFKISNHHQILTTPSQFPYIF